MSFGDLAKIYHLIPTSLKKKISAAYDGLDESLLTNWIQCSAILRNLCAHNSRIYARNIPIPIKIETRIQAEIVKATKGKFQAKPQTLFSYFRHSACRCLPCKKIFPADSLSEGQPGKRLSWTAMAKPLFNIFLCLRKQRQPVVLPPRITGRQ